MQTNRWTKALGFIALTFLVGTSGYSQNIVGYNDGFGSQFGEFSSGNHLITISGNYFNNSNAITNSFTNLGLKTERYISQDIKDDINNKLSENNNRYGSEANFKVEYKQLVEQLFGKDSMAFSIGYYLRDIQYLNISKDALDIYFNGNAPFAGQTKYAKAKVTSFYMNQIRLGLEHVAKGSKWGFGTSLLLGARYQNINMKKGEIFTEQDGEYIDFNTDFSMTYTGDANAKFYELSGAGLAFDFSLQKKLTKTNHFDISIADLGFMLWGNTTAVSADTNIHFEGLEIVNLFNFNEADYEFPDDSLLEYFGLSSEQKTKVLWLPSTLTLSYYHQFTPKISLTSGLRYITNAAYLPNLYFVGSYGKRKQIQLNAIASIGGYGNFLGGLGIEKSFADRVGVIFNFYMFGSTLAPSSSTGQAADIKLYANF